MTSPLHGEGRGFNSRWDYSRLAQVSCSISAVITVPFADSIDSPFDRILSTVGRATVLLTVGQRFNPVTENYPYGVERHQHQLIVRLLIERFGERFGFFLNPYGVMDSMAIF